MYYEPLQVLTGGSLLTTINVFLPGYGTPQRLLVPASTAQVTVTELGSNVAVPVYPNPDGTGTPLAQPLTPDADGRIAGYVEQPQLLDLHISGPNLITRTIPVGESSDPALQGAESTANKDQPGGYAGLDGAGVLLTTLLPGESLTASSVPRQAPGAEWVVNVLDHRWNLPVDGVNDDVPAIQAALDHFHALAGGGGSVRMQFPMMFEDGTRVPYTFKSALIQHERCVLKGEQSYAEGASVCTLFKTAAGGNFTNGDVSEPFMVKAPGVDDRNPDGTQSSGGQAPYYYLHGSAIEDIAFDPSATPGVGAIRWWQPGENSRLDNLVVNRCQSTPRSVTDVVADGSTTIVSATAAFTRADVNALVTGTDAPANAKIDAYIDATHARLNVPVPAGSALHMTINRPTDAIKVVGGAARGRIGTINGIFNHGPLLNIADQLEGSWHIECLSGDVNLGGLLRVSRGALAADPVAITVEQIKAENYPASLSPESFAADKTTMDPVILLDECDVLSLNVLGGSVVTSFVSRDVVRLARSIATRGGPSVYLQGIEGANPFNPAYTNIISDQETGEAVQSFPGDPASGQRAYPNVHWGRDAIVAGGGKVPAAEHWHALLTFIASPVWESQTGEWVLVSDTGQAISFPFGLARYNVSTAIGDAGAWKVDLSAGTWELVVGGVQSTDGAQIAVDFAVGVIDAPRAPTTQAPAGAVPAGNYGIVTTYVTPDGRESSPSPITYQASDGTLDIVVNPPTVVQGADRFNVYMTQAGGSTFTLQNGSPISLGQAFTLAAAPTSTGAAPPAANGTASWTSIGTIDQYATGMGANFWVLPGIVIPRHTGPVEVRFSVTGKNASSTSYVARLCAQDWRRTA